MGLGNIGVSGFILVLVVLLFVFGPSKLPEIGKSFGKSLREFRSAARGVLDESETVAVNSMNEKNCSEPVDLLSIKKDISSEEASHESRTLRA